jgi:hypothetical protein
VIALAEKRGGELVATEVARELRLSLEEADALLTSMADGARVSVEVDSEGIVRYQFRELTLRGRGPRVRVDAGGESAEAGAEAASRQAEAAERVEREFRRRQRL